MLSATVLADNAYCDSIAKGQRGPTEWQLDDRAGITEKVNDAGVKSRGMVSQNVLKYWNGGGKGLFAFGAVPYKSLESGKVKSKGLGGITLGGGPRGAFTNNIGSFHFLPYVSLTLPTGDSKEKPALGNDRLDLKVGSGFTYLTKKNKGEIGAAIEYTKTGLGSRLGTSDELYGGVLVGGALDALGEYPLLSRFRLLSGVTGSVKIGRKDDGKYIMTSRTAVRYTPKDTKRWHAEGWFDYDLVGEGMPIGFGVTGMIRLNF